MIRTTIHLATAIFLLVATPLFAQLRVSLSVSSRPDPYLANWSSKKETAIVTIVNSGSSAVDAKFDCTVSTNGAVQARTKPESMRTISIPPGTSQWFGEDLVPFQAVTFVGSSDRTAAQTGMLPAGTYTFCVRLLEPATLKELTAQVCKNFTLTSYQAPTLLEPANKSTLPKSNRPMFRWTAVSPKFPGVVNYHLQVFEVLPGQTPVTAFKVNQPIIDARELRTTQAMWMVDREPPNTNAMYVWGVRATDERGNTIGEPQGLGGPWSFTACCPGDVSGDGKPKPGSSTTGGGTGTGSGGSSGLDNLSSGSGGGAGGSGSGGNQESDQPKEEKPTGNQPFTRANVNAPKTEDHNGLIAVSPANDARFNVKDKKPGFTWRWEKEPKGVSIYEFKLQQLLTKKETTLRVRTKETKWPSDIPFEEGNYTWKVTALGNSGSQMGTTGTQTFSVMSNNYQIQYSVDSIICTDTPGVYFFSVTLCNTGLLPITFTPTDLTPLDDITGLPDPNIIVTVTNPSSMVTINPPNCITISGTLKNLGTKMTGILQIRTNRVGGNILAAMETENDTLPNCGCDLCEKIKIDTSKGKATVDPKTGHLIITQPIAIGPDPLIAMSADIIFLSWQPENEKCMPCDKDPKEWGVLENALLDKVKPKIGPNGAYWSLGGGQNTGTVSLDISLPQLLDCCKYKGSVCIRYKFYFKSKNGKDCYVCDRVICYSF